MALNGALEEIRCCDSGFFSGREIVATHSVCAPNHVG